MGKEKQVVEAHVKEAHIRFMAPVTPQTTQTLLNILDGRIKAGYDKVHLMISSPGGSVFHGLSVHNFIKGAPIEVDTYNFGSVDSIGVVLFCAGTRRFCVPHARFLMHGVRYNINSNASFDEKQIEEMLNGVKIDQNNIARVIADTTGKEVKEVLQDMHNRTTLNPEEAQEYGLVEEIRSQLFPANAELHLVLELNQPGLSPQPGFPPFAIQQPHPQAAIDPQNSNFTTWFDYGFTYTNSS